MPFSPQIGLEFREYPQHIQKRLAGRTLGVDGLFRSPQGHPPFLEGVDDVLKILDAAGLAFHPGHHEDIAWPEKRQQHIQLASADAGRTLLWLRQERHFQPPG